MTHRHAIGDRLCVCATHRLDPEREWVVTESVRWTRRTNQSGNVVESLKVLLVS